MSQGKTRTILEELNSISVDRNKHHVLENRVEHLVSGVENVKKILRETYDESTALDLERRMINSLKSGDPKKSTWHKESYKREPDVQYKS